VPLTDAQAKAKLRTWPTVTGIWTRSDDTTRWLRAQPPVAGVTGPRLEVPGAGAFLTQPDALWITFGIRPSDTAAVATFADCVVVESCGTTQNFSDKRSRYAPRTTSLVVKLPVAWLDATVTVQSGAVRQRREVLRGQLPPTEDVSLPLRHLRVLYALPNDNGPPSLYERVTKAMALDGHEYVCPQIVLGSYTGQPMQKFLKRMGPELSRFP
jgi:hypothetical protein